jgi:hypothetical protein
MIFENEKIFFEILEVKSIVVKLIFESNRMMFENEKIFFEILEVKSIVVKLIFESN